MKKIVFCEFNLDTACVELCLEDGALLSIDCTAVENELANSMYQRSELDWLIYNDPLAYAELILNGEPELYLKVVTEHMIWSRLSQIFCRPWATARFYLRMVGIVASTLPPIKTSCRPALLSRSKARMETSKRLPSSL